MSETKAKRIVYRVRKQLEDAEIDEDFLKILESSHAPRDEKLIGIEEITKVQGELKDALETAIKFGEQTGLLSYLKPKDFEKLRKNVLSMLISNNDETESDEKHSRYGEEVVVGKIQHIHHDHFSEQHPEPPIPICIPKLNVTDIRDEEKSEYENSFNFNLKSGDRLPSPLVKLIATRPKDVEKVSVGVQMEKVIMKESQVQTSDVEVKTPRVIEDEEEFSGEEDKSEGEIPEYLLSKLDNLICVHSNGEVVYSQNQTANLKNRESQTTPRIFEDEEELLLEEGSSFSLNVRQRTISQSSGSARVLKLQTSSSDADDESHSI
ncbi:unnamed protein product [Caenorhabditis angaria]|uniref:Uncharacterized protein n=1 Tax=Caenorhabditis angaria TaxID=860376 RepID=A0A9P1MUZ2_9PELO|nr:unnamed protein product [Caenorhabditis angaria]